MHIIESWKSGGHPGYFTRLTRYAYEMKITRKGMPGEHNASLP